jgi:hypothetical protein
LTTTIHPVRVSHMNVVFENVDKSLKHLQELYGAEFVCDIPQKEVHAYLFCVGRVLFEAFVPLEFLPVSRYGPHFLGIEYQADMEVVRKAIAERGIRIVRDVTHALHTHPEDTLGVAFEFYGGHFFDMDWPLLGGKIKPAEYWLDEHPLGLTGLKAYTIAVPDMDSGSAFIQSFLGGEPVYEAPRPAIGGRAVGLQVADCIVELVTPTGEGALSQHLYRYGQGIRSTVFGVADIEKAKRYFKERKVELVPGSAPGTFAVPAETNCGAIFEFTE